MPQRPSKGPQGTNSGSKARGTQKATYGSGVSPEVSDEQARAAAGEESDEGAGGDESRAQP